MTMQRRRQRRLVPGTRNMTLFQMNVGTTLPAIRRLNRLRLPLKVVTVGTSNFDSRFSSQSELLTGADEVHTTSGASQQILQRKGLRWEGWTASFFHLPREGICLHRALAWTSQKFPNL
jgi:hypothetical protein